MGDSGHRKLMTWEVFRGSLHVLKYGGMRDKGVSMHYLDGRNVPV